MNKQFYRIGYEIAQYLHVLGHPRTVLLITLMILYRMLAP